MTNRNFAAIIAASRRVFLPFCIICFLVTVIFAADKHKRAVSVRERVAKIVRVRLSDGVMVINGMRVQTRIPPSEQITKEIRECGNAAIPYLENYLRSQDDHKRLIAVELLGLLGGTRVVGPLKNVIEKDRSPTLRILAIRWLSQQPASLTSAIFSKAASDDVDADVRRTAKDILRLPIGERDRGSQVPFQVVPPPF